MFLCGVRHAFHVFMFLDEASKAGIEEGQHHQPSHMQPEIIVVRPYTLINRSKAFRRAEKKGIPSWPYPKRHQPSG